MDPTPPALPWINTRSPDRTCAWSDSACQAVSAAKGSAADSTWDSLVGRGTTTSWGNDTYCAAVPSRWKSIRP